MLTITLPDGAQREYPGPLTVAEVAASIAPGLARWVAAWARATPPAWWTPAT